MPSSPRDAVERLIPALLLATVLAVGAGPASAGEWPLPWQNRSLTRTLAGEGALLEPAMRWKLRLGGVNAPLLVQDVTGDGATDIVTLVGGRAICRDPRDGTLLWASPALQLGFFFGDTLPHGPAAAPGRSVDLDGDGTVDVLASKESVGDTRIVALSGATGKVQWMFGEGLGPNSGVNGANLGVVANLDGDPTREFLLYVPSNVAAGAALYAFDFADGFGGDTLQWRSDGLGYNGRNSLTLAELTGDGSPELLWSVGDTLKMYRSADGATVASTQGWYGPSLTSIPYGAVVVPVEIDGDPESELHFSTGGLGQAGAFGIFDLVAGVPTERWLRVVPGRWQGPAPFELTGDGAPEVVASVYADGRWTTTVYDGSSGGVKAVADDAVVMPAGLQWPAPGTRPTADLDGDGKHEFVLLSADEEAVPAFGTLVVARLVNTELVALNDSVIDHAAFVGFVERVPGVTELAVARDPNGDGRGDAFQLLRFDGGTAVITGTYLFPKDLSVTWRGVFDSVVGPAPGQVVVFTSDGYFDVLGPSLDRLGQRIATGGFAPSVLTARRTAGEGVAGDEGVEAYVKDSAGRTLRVAVGQGDPADPPATTTLFGARSGRSLLGIVDLDGDGTVELLTHEQLDGIDRVLCLGVDGKALRWSFTAPGLVGPPETGTLGIGGDVDGDGVRDVHLFTVIDNLRVGVTLSGATGQPGSWTYRPFQAITGLGTAYSPALFIEGPDGPDVLISRYGDRPNGHLSVSTEAPLPLRVLDGLTGQRLFGSALTPDPGRLALADVDGVPGDEVVVTSWKQLGVLGAELGTRWNEPTGGPITRGMPLVTDLDGDGLADVAHFDHTVGRVRARRGLDGARLWPGGPGEVSGELQLVGGAAYRVLADGAGFAPLSGGPAVASLSGASLGEAAAVVTNLTGQGHPTLLFGSGDGWLYGVDGSSGALDFVWDVGFSVGAVVPTDLDGDGLTEVLVTATDGNLYAVAPAAPVGAISAVTDGLGDDVDLVSSFEDGIDSRRFSARWDAPTGGSEAPSGYLVRLLTATGALVVDWTNVGLVNAVTLAPGVRLVAGVVYVVVVLPYGATGSGKPTRSDGFWFEDSDGDRVLDQDELLLGTDPFDPDSDNDRIDDGVETAFGVGPDTDGDGAIDALDSDSDGDGLMDFVEGVVDTDGDGRADFRDEDDDGDGILTALEVEDGAIWGSDKDADSTPNWQDLDSDDDGLDDSVEGRVDLDDDGLPDYLDRASPPVVPDGRDTPDPVDLPPGSASFSQHGATQTAESGGCGAARGSAGVAPVLMALWLWAWRRPSRARARARRC